MQLMRVSRAFRRLPAFAVAAASVAMALAFASNAEATKVAHISSGGTFNVAQPWGTIPDNFNPYAPSGSNAPGTESCIYQSLYYFNAATGVQTPLLATGYQWTDKDLKLVVTTRSGVTWSDGTAFSAADVAFTFNYLKANPGIDVNGIWSSPLKSVTATGPNTVVFTFSKPDTPLAVTILYGTDGTPTAILPEHLWSSVSDPATYTNTTPIGTGPFTLTNFSGSAVTYTKNAHYWEAGRPYINSVVFNSVDSDTTAELELENGTIDMSYDYLTDAQKTFVDQNPSQNVYFWPASNMNYLYMNDLKAPFNNLAFRKAVSEAVNTKFLASRAYFGALSAATGGAEAAVVQPQVKQWVPTSLASDEYSFSVKQAKATLTAAGFKLKGGKLYTPAGKQVPSLPVLIGAPGWTDYISLADNLVSELHAIGISSSVLQEPYATYANDLDKGNYGFAISWGNGNSSTPYFQYYYMFSPKQSAPIGKVATTDWERYTSPVISSALASYSSTSSTSVQKADMAKIEQQVLENVPLVPLTGRANWLDYDTAHFTGFPSTSDPYNDGSASDQEGSMLSYLNVHQK
jgi:peptide/nickel transport system substrate-binding protein